MVSTSYFYLNSLLLSKIASTLGHDADAERYSALADTLKGEINRKFFNQTTFNYATDTTYQTYQLLAIAGNIVPEEFRGQVLKTVIDDILITRNGHLNTGIIRTKYLWPVLAHAGKSAVAYSILKKTTYPSFGYWIAKGSTTLIEQWDGKNSHNHQMFGSVDEFFYKYLAGIRSPGDGGTTRGYKQIHIQPFVPVDLSFVNATVNSIAGKIESNWQQLEDSFILNVRIPANTSATVSIPVIDYKNISVSENNRKVWDNNTFIEGIPGITGGQIDGNFLNFSIGSGKYDFTVTGK